jgi:integrase/recombinase XerD
MQKVETKKWERQILEYIASYMKESEPAESMSHYLGAYFKKLREETNVSGNTIRIRYFCMSVFEEWLRENKIHNIASVTPKVIGKYLSYCIVSRNQGYSQLKCTKVALRDFFACAVRQNETLENPTENMIVSTRASSRDYEILTPDEMIALMRTAYERYDRYIESEHKNRRHKYYALRDIAMVMVMSATGIRTGELCAIRLSEIDIVAGVIEINGKGNHIYLKKHRKVYIAISEVIEAISKYIAVRPDCGSEVLFTSYEGEPTANYAVIAAIKQLAKRAGIRRNITPFAFRHTVCSAMTHNGADPFSVKEFMGHKKLLTTLHYYTHFNAEQLRGQNASFNPLKGGV